MDSDYKLAVTWTVTISWHSQERRRRHPCCLFAEYLVLVEVLHGGTISGQYAPLLVSPVDVKAHVVRDDFS